MFVHDCRISETTEGSPARSVKSWSGELRCSETRGMPLTRAKQLAGHAGLALRGGFHPRPEDAVPPLADGSPPGTVILFGWTGAAQWSAFESSPEALDR